MPLGTNNKDGEQSPSYAPIEIEVFPAVPVAELESNIRDNAESGFPFLLNTKHGPKRDPLAIVGGGPSLNAVIHELREFRHIMVCGTAHDYIIEKGFTPTYSVFCDQGPDIHAFRQKRQADCHYLLATQCDPSLIEHLKDCRISLWDMDGWVDEKVFEGRGRVNGGSTAAMRAPALAHILGYRDLHIFGVDSSFEDNRDRHAYAYEDERERSPSIGCRINGRKFQTSMEFLAQAKDFQKILENFGHLHAITVHGDSLIADIWKDMKEKSERVFNREKAA